MSDVRSRIKQSRLFQVVAVYLGAGWVILQVTGTLRENLGLPEWVFAAALVLLLVGLLIVVATAWIQSRPGLAVRAAAEEVPEAWELDARDLVRTVARGRLPHLTWARALVGGAVAFLLLFGFAGVYVVLKDGGRSFGRTSPFVGSPGAGAGAVVPGLAVMPFTVSGVGLDIWREGMVDLLSTNLDGVGGLRTVNSRTVLARMRERQVAADAELAALLGAARDTGAGLALVGGAVRLGDDVRLSAELHDLADGRTLGHARVEGPVDSMLTLIDRLSVDVVRRLLERRGDEVSVRSVTSLTTSSMPALHAFLEGEALYRRGDFSGAVRAYERAVDADSLFAMPLYRLSLATGWMTGLGAASVEYGRRARELADRLPARDAELLRAADQALGDGDRDGISKLEALSRRYPDDPEVWYELGEAYNHLGEQALVPVRAMSDAFERAIALDSAFAPAYIHAIEAALSFGDTARARVFVDRFGRHAAPESSHLARLTVMYRAMAGDPAAPAALASMTDDLLIDTLINLDDAFIETEGLREAVIREVLRRRDAGRPIWQSDTPLDYLAAASFHSRGKIAEALSLVDRMPAAPRARLLITMRLDGIDIPETLLTMPTGESWADQFMAAMVAAERADWAEHARRVERLRAKVAIDTTVSTLVRPRLIAIHDGLDAYATWRRGDTEAGARELAASQARFSGYGPAAAMNELFRRAAELALTELGRPADALRYALSHRADPYAAFRAAALHEQLGQHDAARDTYAAVLRAWDKADPDLPHREIAVRRLAALTAESATR